MVSGCGFAPQTLLLRLQLESLPKSWPEPFSFPTLCVKSNVRCWGPPATACRLVPVRVEKGIGMKARILDRNDVLKIADLLQQQGYEVIAPFRGRGRDTFFDPVTDQNRDRFRFTCPIRTIRRSVMCFLRSRRC